MEQPIRKRRRRTKKSLNAKQLMVLAGCVIGAVALIVVACFLIFSPKAKEDFDFENVESTAPAIELGELTIQDISRQGTSMVVKTSYLDVAYPYALSDLLFVEAVSKDGVPGLEFRVKTKSMDEWLYTIWFGGTAGKPVGTYLGQVKVMGEVCQIIPNYLGEDEQFDFKAARDTYDEVLKSMQENENFN